MACRLGGLNGDIGERAGSVTLFLFQDVLYIIIIVMTRSQGLYMNLTLVVVDLGGGWGNRHRYTVFLWQHCGGLCSIPYTYHVLLF